MKEGALSGENGSRQHLLTRLVLVINTTWESDSQDDRLTFK